MRRPQIAFVADDFTGACDTLATLSRGGLRTRLYLRCPKAAPDDLDAVGIATGLRAMSLEEGCAAMALMASQIAALDARVTHFKICSTFDSAPETGNICGPSDLLASALVADSTVVIGGQPSLGRYCLFGTLFAEASNGSIHRIDRHPVMENHPTTPMSEADLRRHLALQGWPDVGLIDYRTCRQGGTTLARLLGERISQGERRIMIDVSTEEDLAAIGAALRSVTTEKRILCIGASSVAEAILASNSATARAVAEESGVEFAQGPVLAIAGSRSQITATQVAAASAYERLRVTSREFLPGSASVTALVERCGDLLTGGANVLVALTDEKDARITGRDLSDAIASFTAFVLSRVRPGCLLVAGGDTSSAIVSGLNVDSIEFIGDLDRGVPLVRARGDGSCDGLHMVLKGGQMGQPTLFNAVARSAAEVS